MTAHDHQIERDDDSQSSGLGSYLPRWRPTSSTDLGLAEKRVLKFVQTPLKLYNTLTTFGKIWTLQTKNEVPENKIPLVMLHGMGAGIGIWVLNLDSVPKNRKVYALDLLGFGRSSRPSFPDSVIGVEDQYLSSLEQWRKDNRLDRFTLLGHSFGGYLATLYAKKYPQHIAHLILADPWGYSKVPEVRRQLPLRWKLVVNVMKPFNIFSGLRAAGPLGPKLVNKMRPDLKLKFNKHVKDVDAVPNYIYHCNAQDPSGEVAFKSLHLELGFARFPLIDRIADLDKNMPITMIYGAQSWMDPTNGYRVQELREGMAPVAVELILNAGHHVYADDPTRFNSLLDEACGMYENRIAETKSIN